MEWTSPDGITSAKMVVLIRNHRPLGARCSFATIRHEVGRITDRAPLILANRLVFLCIHSVPVIVRKRLNRPQTGGEEK
jgi:hypothetical protein